MGSDNPIAETTRRILTDLADPQAINKAGDGWKAPAWSALEQAGLTLAWVPEDLGGSGADLADGFAVLREAGRFALAVPLAETLLAGWLLARAGIPAPKGAMTCAPARDGDRVTLAGNGTLSGALRSVPFAKDAKHLALLARRDGGLAVALVEASQARIADHDGHRRRSPQRRALRRRAAGCGQECARRSRRAGAAADGCRGALHADGGRARGDPRSLGRLRQRARRLRAADRQVPGRAAQPRAPRRRDGRRHRRRRPRPPTRSPAPRLRRSRVPRGRLRQDPRRRGRHRRARPSPTRCSAPSASRRSTRCIASRAACGAGATTSAARAPGRSSSATWSRPRAPTGCGPCWRRR